MRWKGWINKKWNVFIKCHFACIFLEIENQDIRFALLGECTLYFLHHWKKRKKKIFKFKDLDVSEECMNAGLKFIFYNKNLFMFSFTLRKCRAFSVNSVKRVKSEDWI